jgi:hypothetical protein
MQNRLRKIKVRTCRQDPDQQLLKVLHALFPECEVEIERPEEQTGHAPAAWIERLVDAGRD